MRDHETLRSTQLPLDILGGTRLFLRYYAGKRRPYVIETRWQVLRQTTDVSQGAALFEDIALGAIPPRPYPHDAGAQTPQRTTMTTHEALEHAIVQWRAQADFYTREGNIALADSCERTAQALEIERDTGIAVCSCCHTPCGRGVQL